MDVATALSVAQTLFATLQCAEVRKLCSIFKYESELEKLVKTVETINCLLRDADSKCLELSHEGQRWVQNLKNAVYDADDLFDEYKTVARQLDGMPGGKLSKEVRRFFSSKNHLLFAYKKSAEVKRLREELDSLSANHRNFGFSELYKLGKSREKTCSYVYEHNIIGRDAEKEEIVNLLKQDVLEVNISFVTIVGIGGLGKTALAQLVFNDPRIKEAFYPNNMYWVCVSFDFGMKDILGKIVRMKNLIEFEELCKEVRKQIEGKKYLLILDDVWSTNNIKWEELKEFLILGGRGSRIVVTTRSKEVAHAISKCPVDGVRKYTVHDLKGLSDDDSWELFKKISIEQRGVVDNTSLVEIGKDIVKKCDNVPLFIKVVASLLRGQDIASWESYRKIDLAKMREDEDDELMPTLMFSYYLLDPALKIYFSFCSVFPQDYVISKKKLIRLWSAHGYLKFVPGGTDNSMEDVGERYFSILLNRCFFQDFSLGSYRGVYRVKMHDLIHDLSRKVAGETRHIFLDSDENLTNYLGSRKILRTCLRSREISSEQRGKDYQIVTKFSRLRVLDLRYSQFCRAKLDRVGKLLHLRYLDLSVNVELEMLPKSITKLHNLQTLILTGCRKLKKLPEDTSKIVNLRVLDIVGCDELTYMPAGMGKLTCLHTLARFILDGEELEQGKIGKLKDLKELMNNLRGYLNVINSQNSNNRPLSGYMDVQLYSSKLKCNIKSYHKKSQELLLVTLLFNHQIQKLIIDSYSGTKLPSWASGLMAIRLSGCKELQYLPSSLSQLCHLKKLHLEDMENVEYIDSDAPSPSVIFLPCFEYLMLCKMAKLKGWWGDNIRWMEKDSVFVPSFPQLKVLYISKCERMTYFPPCALVESMRLYNVNDTLTFCKIDDVGQRNSFPLKNLDIVCTDNSSILNSLGREYLGSVGEIVLEHIDDFGRMREEFQSCASSLQQLELSKCGGMENLRVEQLTNLKSLRLLESNLEGLPWKDLHRVSELAISYYDGVKLAKGTQYLTSLHSLILDTCSNMEDLRESFIELSQVPGEMHYLSSLATLEIYNCPKLKSLSEGMCYLTSLTTLNIQDCQQLKSLPEAISHLTNLTIINIMTSNSELED